VKKHALAWLMLAGTLSGCPGLWPFPTAQTGSTAGPGTSEPPANPFEPRTSPSAPTPPLPTFRDPNAVLPEGLLPPSYLVSNQAGSLAGIARGPATLVANNAGSLISNNSSGLVANNAGSLISNNSSGLVSNQAGAYRVQAVASAGVTNGFVYLTTPGDRIYVRQSDRRLFAALTDAEGRFELGLPATDSVIVNVLMRGDRRLTAIVRPDEASGSVDAASRRVAGKQVTLATTLVTEFLRSKGEEFGFTIEEVVARADVRAKLSLVESLTDEWLTRDAVVASFQLEDLAVSRIPVLRQKYVVAIGTTPDGGQPDYRLSDAWVELLRTIKRDPDAPDLKYRPLAVTSLETGAIGGSSNHGITVDERGSVYAQFLSNTNYELRKRNPATGVWEPLVSQLSRGPGLPLTRTNFLRWVDGKLLFGNSDRDNGTWVGLLDPARPLPSLLTDVPDWYGTDSRAGVTWQWNNPGWLFFPYTESFLSAPGASDGIEVADALLIKPGTALGSNYNLIICDGLTHSVWRLDGVDPASASVSLRARVSLVAGQVGAVNDSSALTNNPEASGSLRFNGPVDSLYREDGGIPHLLVSDTANHSIVDINLVSGTSRRVVGEAGPYDGLRQVRRALPVDGTVENGAEVARVHLNYPHQLIPASRSTAVYLGDSDNRLIRTADPFGTGKSWILAGDPAFLDKPAWKIPFSAIGDGEARRVYISRPYWLARDPAGNILFNEELSSRLRKLWSSFLYQERVQP